MQRPDNADSLAAAIDRFPSARVLVVGDLILDRFISGTVQRISPEAPVPVVRKLDERAMLGGAGNVATNLIGYGAEARLVGLAGDDANADRLEQLCAEAGRLKARIIRDKTRRTTVKTRIVAQSQQMMRLDEETPDAAGLEMEQALISQAIAAMDGVSVVVLSDYAKGVLGRTVCAAIIGAARKAEITVLVDPKSRDLSTYAGADLISPNLRELETITGLSASGDKAAETACAALLEERDLGAVLLTRGEAGMTLARRNASPIHFRAEARSVYDVSGAGDTVIATLAAGLAAGLELPDAVALGNTAAGIAVGKAGTSTVSPYELRHQLGIDAPHRPLALEEARAIVQGSRDSGRIIGFTNGCFDLLHEGHLYALEQAKKACDVLVVGVNADASVRRLKGAGRPIQNEMSRARVLACLDQTDIVIIFGEDTPLELIKAIQPDILFKGEDYSGQEVVGADIVKVRGGRVELIPLIKGVSTTATVNRMQDNGRSAGEKTVQPTAQAGPMDAQAAAGARKR
jgi:D-beta-D-heptose 7-phosphate kinase/D-beta-D-heptose 1-phosphate adenosyltransferase